MSHKKTKTQKRCANWNLHYKVNLAIPLLDYIISDFGERFSKLSVIATSQLGFVPAASLADEEVNLNDAIATYNPDLPSPELLPPELMRWRLKMSAEDRPASPAAAIKECDATLFPNIRILLQIAYVLQTGYIL